MGYIDENGLAEFTTKIKAYFEKKFYGENVLLTTNSEMLQTGDGMFLNVTPEPQPQEEYFLTFSSPNSFTLNVVDNTKYWDGTLETSTDKTNWTTWSGTNAVNSASDGTNHNIYVRGIGNTYITGSLASSNKGAWRLNGSNISISGNIENLLDYATVEAENHPAMASDCYKTLFSYNTSLTGNTNITDISNLKLSANVLTTNCYRSMFHTNKAITKSPKIFATVLAESCCAYMFSSCNQLTSLPTLSAIILANYCYQQMFQSCLAIKISTTQTGEYVNEYRIPETGTGTDSSNANGLTNMFAGTGGTFTGTPTINTTYYTSNEVV